MTRLKCVVALGIVFLFIGCPARSLFPLFAEKDLVFNPSLLGTWIGEGGKETFAFQPSKAKGYRVIYREYKSGQSPTDTAVFNVQLGQLGKCWFLNSSPVEESREYHMIPTHLIWRMWLEGDMLRIAALESDWLRDMINGGKLKISHALVHGDVILTASPEELQQLVLRFAEDSKAFPNEAKLSRKK